MRYIVQFCKRRFWKMNPSSQLRSLTTARNLQVWLRAKRHNQTVAPSELQLTDDDGRLTCLRPHSEEPTGGHLDFMDGVCWQDILQANILQRDESHGSDP